MGQESFLEGLCVCYVASVAQSMVFCYGSPSKLMHKVFMGIPAIILLL